MTPENFTDDQIRELVPEATDFTVSASYIIFHYQRHIFRTWELETQLWLIALLELKEAREQLATVASDALEYALESRNAVIDDNRPRYQRQRDLIDGDLARFRAIIDGHPVPPETQAPSLAGMESMRSIQESTVKKLRGLIMKMTNGIFGETVLEILEETRDLSTVSNPDATLTARIAELEGALKTPNIDSICLSFRHDFGLLSEEARESIRYDCREWAQAIMKEILE